MEERLGVRLVDKQVGVRHGGEWCLTRKGKELLKRCETVEYGIRALVDERFVTALGGQTDRL